MTGMGAKAERRKAKQKERRIEQAVAEVADDGARLGGFGDALRVGNGFVLADVDPRGTPAFDGGKKAGAAALEAGSDELADLLERLWAESTAGSKRALLLVVQGMDTAGKGGVMKHVVAINPEGVRATAFKRPTPEEQAHDFLWRIRKALPGPGQLGVFDRSHYEDVLVVRVHELVPPHVWSERYEQINAFEREVEASGTQVIKVMLHISRDEQRDRLMGRLERPDKYWKFNPRDTDERGHWLRYTEAYETALAKCSTDESPWYVVPADRKWYARLAVQQLVLEALRELHLDWPAPHFDVEAEKQRLRRS
jgi:PPK2 family polyphosphate:nucleotide phosphotransferase